MIAGVCGGLAEYFDLDPTVVRVAYVLISIVSVAFPGILAYIILMFVMPPPDSPRRRMTRPRILVTNDDGVFSEGIERLAAALAEVGDVFTVAPDQERSAAGHSLTLHHPLRAKLVGPAALVRGRHADRLRELGRPAPAEGRPAEAAVLRDQPRAQPRRRRDLLGHGLRRLRGDADRDLVGRDLAGDRDGLHVRRGRGIRGAPGAAPARPAAAAGTLVNVNVPAGAPRGVRVVRQGKRRYGEAVIEKTDPRGRPYYWIGATPPKGDLEQGTDLSAVAEKFISMTPLHLDLTDYRSLSLLEDVAGKL